jgi:hypothetical protein
MMMRRIKMQTKVGVSIEDKIYNHRYSLLVDRLAEYVPKEILKVPEGFIDGLFEHATKEDFRWDQDEAFDSVPWRCDNEECPGRWHAGNYYLNMGRKKGKIYVEILWDSHGDGDAQPYIYWKEGEDPLELCEHLVNSNDGYFAGWAEYYLDCYVTGNDPLHDSTKPFSKEGFLAAAGSMLRYLFMNKKKGA